MNYQQTLDYLYHSLPMFSRMGSAAYKKDLTNIRILCERLGNPHLKFRSIHVGGTNGKGSVSHMLAAAFQSAGYTTGLYTSPHLYDFRERIRIDGVMIPEDFVVNFVGKIQPLIREIEPSFFEITVAMAFDYFVYRNIDIAIVEVGLGGRLDSTNIITPVLSVITNIGWDHMNLLGDTLAAIAAEKAGIIKAGVPVVIGETQGEIRNVFEEKATASQSPLVFADQAFSTLSHNWKDDLLHVEVLDKETGTLLPFDLDLPGIYQTRNICTVLAALRTFQKSHGSEMPSWNTVHHALGSTRQLTGLQGRWERIRTAPDLVLEVAHNKEGVEQMLQHIALQTFGKLHLVIGTVNDKDVDAVLSRLPPNASYYFTQAQIPRALEAEKLKEHAARYALEGTAFRHVNDAVAAALASSSPDDLIVVCGSIFLVAEVERT